MKIRVAAVVMLFMSVLVACGSSSPSTAPPVASTVAQGDDEPLTAALAPKTAADSTIHCGYVRWAVKTGADPLAGQVNTKPKRSSIRHLTSLTPPFKPPTGRYPPNYRRFPVEEQMYSVTGTITQYNVEQDNDLHLVITSGSAHMIVEIPNPACVKGGPFLAGITDARKAFLDQTGFVPVPPPPGHYSPKPIQTSIKATVVGVLFFDFVHGQFGVAKNGAELHPVTSISFG